MVFGFHPPSCQMRRKFGTQKKKQTSTVIYIFRPKSLHPFTPASVSTILKVTVAMQRKFLHKVEFNTSGQSSTFYCVGWTLVVMSVLDICLAIHVCVRPELDICLAKDVSALSELNIWLGQQVMSELVIFLIKHAMSKVDILLITGDMSGQSSTFSGQTCLVRL